MKLDRRREGGDLLRSDVNCPFLNFDYGTRKKKKYVGKKKHCLRRNDVARIRLFLPRIITFIVSPARVFCLFGQSVTDHLRWRKLEKRSKRKAPLSRGRSLSSGPHEDVAPAARCLPP